MNGSEWSLKTPQAHHHAAGFNPVLQKACCRPYLGDVVNIMGLRNICGRRRNKKRGIYNGLLN
ncbi:hypothetical protein D1BOALGB6SA_1101 [Olavius sp. associated proteobacterium Delta 1]|nr:hypothetical protein D1BOALGB6SA_1101 [Olavius sp. associated proteobacterium Delta 1]